MIIHGDPETALFNFGFLVDPLSETAQKWGPLIKVWHEKPGVLTSQLVVDFP